MLPGLRFMISAAFTSVALMVTVLGLAAVRITHQATIDPIEPSHLLAYADPNGRKSSYDADSAWLGEVPAAGTLPAPLRQPASSRETSAAAAGTPAIAAAEPAAGPSPAPGASAASKPPVEEVPRSAEPPPAGTADAQRTSKPPRAAADSATADHRRRPAHKRTRRAALLAPSNVSAAAGTIRQPVPSLVEADKPTAKRVIRVRRRFVRRRRLLAARPYANMDSQIPANRISNSSWPFSN